MIHNTTRLLNDDIYKMLAEKYNTTPQMIFLICNSPFQFAKEVIAHPTDTTPIRFAYLFSLQLKNKFKNDKTISNGRSKENN